MFGPHLIIDGSKCDTAKLGDRLLIERILTDFPRAIGMTRIGGPYMFEYQAPDPAYSGVSGLVVIAESHIAIHTFPDLDYFTMDIFSCKNFDHEIAINYIREKLSVGEMDRMLVQRGLSFHGPHHGPLGATDELIDAAREREAGIGVTIGSIPIDDPLYPRHLEAQGAGKMLWPAYGVTPDAGTYGADAVQVAGGMRAGARVIPANAAAAGALAAPGLDPVQPMQLNPTASTSGVLERLAVMGGQGRALGRALDRWEALARTNAPVVLALGPNMVAEGARDLVTDLLHRGHVAAVILEGDALLGDAYESLGYRHYVHEDAEEATPTRSDEEWATAREQIAGWLHFTETPTGAQVARRLGIALGEAAPRPGILATAAQLQIPVFAIGATELAQVGLPNVDVVADVTTLQMLLAQPDAGLVAFGTTAVVAAFVGTSANTVIAIDAAPLLGEVAHARTDAALALPILATGLVQRLPKRHRATPPDVVPAEERTLQPVG